MKGLQDAGVMACAKHFPGHGDVSVDSHLDLPVINKDRRQLDSLELYPFRKMFEAGVGSVMPELIGKKLIDFEFGAVRATRPVQSGLRGDRSNDAAPVGQ